jgi:predicted nucleotidyltransferase
VEGDVENILNRLTHEVSACYGENLVGLFLYGSAASGDFHEKFSDLNILCVLNRISLDFLKKSAKTVTWFVRKGNPPPMFLTQEELETAHDVFPIEFLDMQLNHRLLVGRDVLADLHIDRENHRLELEHELRTKYIGLRQTFLTVHQNPSALEDLIFRSLSSFVTLMRHVLLLAGEPAPLQKQDIIKAFCAKFDLDESFFIHLLQIRKKGGGLPASQVEATFQRYFEEIGKLIKLVDELP